VNSTDARNGLTRRGWSLLGGALGLGLASRLLGVVELMIAGVAGVALVVAALVLARRGAGRLDATRILHPPRVHAGTPARVDITVENRGPLRTPVMSLADAFDGGRRRAHFLVAPLDRGHVARAAYRVPTQRRGVYTIGPLTAGRNDAFGLAQVVQPLAGAVELTVYPPVETILPLPPALGRDPLAGASRATHSPSGEDFFTLREYVQGDDLRRVHWKSTARSDDLMIRQNEMPWQARTTVLLDNRRHAHTAESFERCVEMTASIVTALSSRQTLLRFVTAGGFELGFAEGLARYATIMEHLATVRVDAGDRLAAVIARLRRGSIGGTVVIVTAAAAPEELRMLARLQSRFHGVVVVRLLGSAYGGVDGPRSAWPGVLDVAVDATTPFPLAWNQAMTAWRQRASARV